MALLLADFASNDTKVGVLGGAWAHTYSPAPPQAVVVVIEVPGAHLNETFALDLRLVDEQEPVAFPDPFTGELRPIRVAQNMVAASIPGVPSRAGNKVSFVINMAPGMPLRPDHLYTWIASIDGVTRPDWQTSFFVVDAPAPPVVG